ncbi:hypothetical protein F2Q68_00017778 [Brassica cretica]|uniref:Uncharacterized protein n=1 Tax=Brassica cretica TaxID=69181 RepID=A0A8S9HM76_BRACR|nr:hypothetical protein F2Q68_00017778 [Brassica cretica]
MKGGDLAVDRSINACSFDSESPPIGRLFQRSVLEDERNTRSHLDHAAVRKNQLILDYELSLRRMASDFAKAEAAIESKDAEIEKSKRVALDKAKEMIAERSRYHHEHKQDAEIIKGLEGELEAARSRIDRLEA